MLHTVPIKKVRLKTMHFDDRLATALRLSGGGLAFARIQYRQLVDLLGTMPCEGPPAREDSAYQRLAELSAVIPADVRARMLEEAGVRLRNPRLIALLSQGEPAVARAAIRQADLDEEQWLDLAPALPLQARGVMRHRRNLGPAVERLMAKLGIVDRGLPAPPAAQMPAGHDDAVESAEEAEQAGARIIPFAPPPAVSEPREGWPSRPPIDSIAALVERIESFRKARQQGEPVERPVRHPRLPLGDADIEPPAVRTGAFDFATDGDGRIVWATAAMAPMVIGMRLASPEPGGALHGTAALVAAVRRRQPIRAEQVTLEGAPAVAGAWRLDASPRFDPVGGRFTGYAGRLRRLPELPVSAPQTAATASGEGDRIRQLLHELRTPINAIQGFAEVIQQQLFGPTPHEYRALAATIAGDAARMLAGFEELERLAKLQTGAMALDAGECDFADVLTATIAQLEAFTGPRNSGFELRLEGELPLAIISRPEAERLVWRLLATLAAAAMPGEVLKLRARDRDGHIRLTLRLPDALAARSDEELFRATAAASPQSLSTGMFGSGFALRLACAEAAAAGGSVQRRAEKLKLSLPGLTRQQMRHSQ